VIQLRKEIIWRAVDGRVVGLDLRSSRYFSLNDTAAMLWESLHSEVEPSALADRLVSEFHVERDAAQSDVASFLAQLQDEGLLAD